MKFKHGTRRRALEYEKEWVETWKKNKTFEKSVENRSKDDAYVFYDGPPFITGVPHHGTLLSSIVKDAVPRYWTMKGKRVERVWGWDCHGLPAENFVEKQLNIVDRRQIMTNVDDKAPLDKDGKPLPTISLEKYITKARESMVANSESWEGVIDRIGRWVDFKGAYKTMDKNFMESVWWAFKELYDKGKIYEGEKVLMYDTKFATPVSKNEVTMDNDAYQTVTDPSVYVKFRLEERQQNINNLRVVKREIVGGGIVSSDGKILLGHNRKGGVFEGCVVVPGGGVDEGETQLHAFQREMLEEVGIDIKGARAKKEKLVMTWASEKILRDTGERVFVEMELHNYTATLDKEASEVRVVAEDDFEDAKWYSRDDLLQLSFSPTTARYLRHIGYLPTDFRNAADADPVYVLAWTTTPWTLPANTALAVGKDVDYVEVELSVPDAQGLSLSSGVERLILAKDLVEKVLVDDKKKPLEYKIIREMKGAELIGLEYEPLFNFAPETESRNKDSVLKRITDKDFDIDAPDFDESSSWKREAARAILEDSEGKIALMYSRKYEYYKLPGGGIDEGESRKEALLRELLEEVGANAEILEEVGTIEERRACSDNQLQTSYAYHAKVVGKVGENHLEENEVAEQFEVVWASLDKAIELTQKGNRDTERGLGMRFMAYRDELLLREYKKQLMAGGNSKFGKNAHKIWSADYVSTESGTGIVHIAPIYGEDDFELAKANDIPRVHVLDDNGFYYPEVAEELFKLMPWVDSTKLLEVWENNKNIAKGLQKAGKVWKVEYVEHEYPFNPRSKQRIMYRAIPSWFFDIQGSKPLMLEQNENINWFPPHLKHGRFAKNIEQAPDWNLSRDRFWATAMPVWKGDKGTIKVVGSYAELKELSGVELDDYHRPWVDYITFDIDGEHFTRIDKVLDCWFESGSMPFAQLHYPFENKEKFEQNYPADFIVEYVGQVRAWFYYVHTVNTTLADIGAFGDKDQSSRDNVTELCFVRHGQTDANIAMMNGDVIGEDDSRLNSVGREQASEVAEKLKDEEFDVILTSPYKRALETAEIINSRLNLPVVVIDNLRERDGDAVDMKAWHETFDFDKQIDFDGESITQFFERVYDGIDKIKRDYAGKKVLIVSHGGVHHGFYAYFNRLPWRGNLRIDKIHNADCRRYRFSDMKNPSRKNAFKNVIVTGNIMGNDGRKLSKSLGNFTDPNELMDKFSADSLRFLLLSSPLLKGEDFLMSDKDVGDVARKLSMVWNMYDFFTMYAEVDGWEYDSKKSFTLDPDDLTNPLDIWIVSRLHQLNEQVTENMDNYNIPDALSPILPFLDDASNWYVRRSRRRFWKSEDDGDKDDAYKTLHYVLLKLSVILAPFTPFLAEELYQKLGGGNESVHLLDWPANYATDQQVLDDMARTRELINAGLGLRMKKDENQESIKVRQPLQFASYSGDKLDDYYEQIIQEELNVKEVRYINSLSEYLTGYDAKDETINKELWIEVSKKITPELKREGLMREVIRFVQSARKNAGLNVDDRIELKLKTADEQLSQTIDEYRDVIFAETLAIGDSPSGGYQETVVIEGGELNINLAKTGRK